MAFETKASNVIPADVNGQQDVFRLDRETGRLSRVSVGPQSVAPNGESYGPRVDADGRVLFSSAATNLVAGDTNDARDAFRYTQQ